MENTPVGSRCSITPLDKTNSDINQTTSADTTRKLHQFLMLFFSLVATAECTGGSREYSFIKFTLTNLVWIMSFFALLLDSLSLHNANSHWITHFHLCSYLNYSRTATTPASYSTYSSSVTSTHKKKSCDNRKDACRVLFNNEDYSTLIQIKDLHVVNALAFQRISAVNLGTISVF